jgi:long-chain acyl-CoA synthetase
MSATCLNVAHFLDRSARLTPDRTAVVCGPTRLTYRALDGMATKVAAGLLARGIGPGHRVLLTCPNVPYFPAVYFGILKAGATVVPINVLLKPAEIAFHLRDADAAAYLCFEGTPELPMAAMGKAAFDEAGTCRHFVVMPRDPKHPPAIDGATTLEAFVTGYGGAGFTEATRPDDTAVILYTSGTTGQPKGAELTHLNVVLNASSCSDILVLPCRTSLAEPVVSLITLPLFHSFGQVCQMVSGVHSGNTLVLLPRFEPAAVVQTMLAERVNLWCGVPTMYWALMDLLRRAEAGDPAAPAVDVAAIAASMRLCVSGGAPMPVALLDEVGTRLGVRLLEGYGLSETSPVATFNHIERPSKPGTVGQPLLGVEVACVDDAGEPVATGERGEVVIRGPNIMKGYFRQPEATADVLRHGWFHTGDIGILDADGYLAIVDRKKDMILRGGFNVYPREIEDLLLTHPAVSQCAVVGVPDERLGEAVKAFIVCRPGQSTTEEAIVRWCRERIATYKAPRDVALCESLPMGATGKVLKRVLRAGG